MGYDVTLASLRCHSTYFREFSVRFPESDSRLTPDPPTLAVRISERRFVVDGMRVRGLLHYETELREQPEQKGNDLLGVGCLAADGALITSQ
jgi:hypothetical protein